MSDHNVPAWSDIDRWSTLPPDRQRAALLVLLTAAHLEACDVDALAAAVGALRELTRSQPKSRTMRPRRHRGARRKA